MELDLIKSTLNEQELQELERLSENTILIDALRKLFLFPIYGAGTLQKDAVYDPMQNFAVNLVMSPDGNDYVQNNERIGERLRACCEGIRMVKTGFATIQKFKPELVEEEKEEENPAR